MRARRLTVNVDHVATLREARRGREPDPVVAATLAILGGADGIVVHLRPRRLAAVRGPSSVPSRPCHFQPMCRSQVRARATGDGLGTVVAGTRQPANHAADERGSRPLPPRMCYPRPGSGSLGGRDAPTPRIAKTTTGDQSTIQATTRPRR